MPIYEYGCEGCGERLEVQQKLADAPLKTCPACGKDLLEKLISPTAFVLKGAGWYKDGYSGGEKPKRTEKQVTDRLQKAVDEDKKKAAPSETPSTPASSSGSSTAGSATGSAGSSSGGGDSGKSSALPA